MPKLLLCGDVMTGRGVDQILPNPGDPRLEEPSMDDARGYVELAEAANGPIPRPVPFTYPWGDALAQPEWFAPDVRIVNLETSITRSELRWPRKVVHYRMSPENAACLTAARIDVCVLANNHVLDHGRPGLVETLDTLERVGVRVAGAGLDLPRARDPAVVELAGGGRIIVFALGAEDSGIPATWAATPTRSGIDLVRRLDDRSASGIAECIRRAKQPGDLVVASIHWGSNWGWEVPSDHVRFAHHLVDAGVDVVHGHSSHHVRPIEVYRNRLVLYGCGDFIDDYEGITGYEEYRGDLALAYVVTTDPGCEALGLRLLPFRIRNMRLVGATSEEARWLLETLNRISTGAARFELAPGVLKLSGARPP